MAPRPFIRDISLNKCHDDFRPHLPSIGDSLGKDLSTCHTALAHSPATMKASSVVRMALQPHGVTRRSLNHQYNFRWEPSSHLFHSVAGPLLTTREDDEQRLRPGSLPSVSLYHTTAPVEKGAALVLGLGAISAASFAAAQGVKAYREWKESQPETPVEELKEEQAEEQTSTQQQEESGPRENVFKKWFDAGVGAKYYEGGFEETMTRREAALILGVRESSTAKRIKEAHRKLLILNHPDTGGSTYIAGKINEAKELLLKGKKDK